MLVATSPTVTIRQAAVSAMDNNVYLLTSRATGQQVLIDAANDPAAINHLLQSAAEDAVQPQLTMIVTTHRHFDHLLALGEMARTTGATLVAGRADVAAIEQTARVSDVQPVDHGDHLTVGDIELAVIGLRGHTPGGIALAYVEPGQPAYLFTGDSLFPGGVGATDRDPVRFWALLSDVNTRLFGVFADDAIVLPGHGRSTTIGEERGCLPLWAARGW